MTTSHGPDAKMFARAREALRTASRTEKLDLLRRAGALADRPHLGDKVVARDMFGDAHFGVVVGVDAAQGEWMVVRHAATGVVLASLDAFSGRGVVELIDRAPAGAAPAAVKAALGLVGQSVDLKHFDYPEAPRAEGDETALDVAGMLGLTLAADALERDRSWNEDTGRYRDRRGWFTE